MKLSPTVITFVTTCLLCGLAGAFMTPLLTLYLTEALEAKPLMVSVFLCLSITSGILVSQWIATFSDRGIARKKLILLGLVCTLVASLVFAATRSYVVALTVAIAIFSFNALTLPQIFALIREYADSQPDTDSHLLMTSSRACIAIAWVLGPPLAFICHDAYGFTFTFAISAAISLVNIILVVFMLPDVKTQTGDTTDKDSDTNQARVASFTPWYTIPKVVLFALAVWLMFFANNLYIISLPLYIMNEMQVASSWVGKLFGLAAFIEIPIMIGGGLLVKYFGAKRMVAFGVTCGVIFSLAMSQTTAIWQMFVLQILNGIFIGTTATLGMVILQDMMPTQRGVATTLFSNGIQLGTLTAALAFGFIGEYINYHFAFYLSAGATSISLLLIVVPSLVLRHQSRKSLST
ncbi:sugar efflux transporter [Veronia pacifica]|uniref:Major facilitator superfamily (MFS) profile domain-containing protein n=1 Tax=Veronia pacifica TaxID=1080227 RepID=A0A1C3EME2_9GAMM|nr:sugar efflux transporter [Veronia pacifica]ODA34389.1 hypothetical protein A8L45_06605 [Veronia pacifica]